MPRRQASVSPALLRRGRRRTRPGRAYAIGTVCSPLPRERQEVPAISSQLQFVLNAPCACLLSRYRLCLPMICRQINQLSIERDSSVRLIVDSVDRQIKAERKVLAIGECNADPAYAIGSGARVSDWPDRLAIKKLDRNSSHSGGCSSQEIIPRVISRRHTRPSEKATVAPPRASGTMSNAPAP